MDPATKRHLWNTICQIRAEGKCVILTSHSMEECEALCTKIVVMVNGSFKCLGSSQHLKDKFTKAYTLTIKLKKSLKGSVNTQSVETFILRNFPSAVLKERHQELLTFYISVRSIPCSRMFGTREGEVRVQHRRLFYHAVQS